MILNNNNNKDKIYLKNNKLVIIMHTIKTRNLQLFHFSTRRLEKETRLIPPPLDSRDETYFWKKPKIKSYKYLLEFPDTILLSRIFISKPPAIQFSLEIANEENGEYILIGNEIKCTKDAMKAINIGFLPCRFIRITTQNDKPFPKPSTIKCYGFQAEYIQKKHGPENKEILYDRAEEILYR